MISILKKIINGKEMVFLFSVIILLFSVNPWNQILLDTANTLRNPLNKVIVDESTDKILNIIKANTTKNDKIQIIGNNNIFYLLSHKLASSKFSYQFPIFEKDPSLMERFKNDLVYNIPKIVISTNYKNKQFRDVFFTISNYNLIYKTGDGVDSIGVYCLKNN